MPRAVVIRPAKLTFDEALQRINDERPVGQVQAAALRRKVWIAEWHLPGCLSESRSYRLTKADAIEAALSMAETESGPPRGMKAALQRWGRFDGKTALFGMVINTVEQHTLADLI